MHNYMCYLIFAKYLKTLYLISLHESINIYLHTVRISRYISNVYFLSCNEVLRDIKNKR